MNVRVQRSPPAVGIPTVETVSPPASTLTPDVETADSGAWRRLAICRGPVAADFFTPFGGETRRQRSARERRAVAICADCPVRGDCLADAVSRNERYGIWGGRAFDERTSLRQQPPLPSHLRPTA